MVEGEIGGVSVVDDLLLPSFLPSFFFREWVMKTETGENMKSGGGDDDHNKVSQIIRLKLGYVGFGKHGNM